MYPNQIDHRREQSVDAIKALSELPPDVPSDMQRSIGFLRQWLNEDRIPQGKEVTSAELWHWLKDIKHESTSPNENADDLSHSEHQEN